MTSKWKVSGGAGIVRGVMLYVYKQNNHVGRSAIKGCLRRAENKSGILYGKWVKK